MGTRFSTIETDTPPSRRPQKIVYSEPTVYPVNTTLLKTGDIVLFKNVDSSSIIDSWNHVALVFNSPKLYPDYGPLILECSSDFQDNLRDIASGKELISGARLVKLEETLQTSQAKRVSFRTLEGQLPQGLDVAILSLVAGSSRKPHEKDNTTPVYDATTYEAYQTDYSHIQSNAELLGEIYSLAQVTSSPKAASEFTAKKLASTDVKVLSNRFAYGPIVDIQRRKTKRINI